MSLQGHEDDVFVIECATFSKNLAVTAGHDGRIKMWNINSGEVLLDYYNMIDGQVIVSDSQFGGGYKGQISTIDSGRLGATNSQFGF